MFREWLNKGYHSGVWSEHMGYIREKNKQRTYIFSGKTTFPVPFPKHSFWLYTVTLTLKFDANSLLLGIKPAFFSFIFLNVTGGKSIPLLDLPKTWVSSDMMLFCLTIFIFKDYQEGTETVCTCPDRHKYHDLSWDASMPVTLGSPMC